MRGCVQPVEELCSSWLFSGLVTFAPMQKRSNPPSWGFLRAATLLVLLALLALGAGWWWFLGRFRLPEKPPGEKSSVSSVLDYAGKRDLGTDPLEAMLKPSLSDMTQGGAEAKLHLASWTSAYARATLARAGWKAAEALGVLADALPGEQSQLDYLHQAQLAEYWRARYKNALED